MRYTNQITVAQRGIGIPDYSKEISAAKTRPGLLLKYTQELAYFGYVATDTVVHPYPVSWVKPVIESDETVHIIDVSTGLALPYSLPAGYAATLIETTWNFNKLSEMQLFFDDLLVSLPGYTSEGNPQHVSRIEGYSTLIIDPTAASAHTIDYTIINRGDDDMSGGMEAIVLIEAIGTPPFPKEKTVKCPFCENQQIVPRESSIIICSKCNKQYIVYANRK